MAELAIRFTDKLNSLDVFAKMNGNAVHFERHHQSQNTESILDDKKALGDREMDTRDLPNQPAATRTLMIKAVIKACPDKASQAPGKRITSWPALAAAAEIFRPMLGISSDAWDMARDAMGIDLASACIAIILQRSALSSDAVSVSKGNAIETRVFGIPAITSPGGYLRTLTEEFKAGRLSVPNLVMTINTTRMRNQYVREVATP